MRAGAGLLASRPSTPVAPAADSNRPCGTSCSCPSPSRAWKSVQTRTLAPLALAMLVSLSLNAHTHPLQQRTCALRGKTPQAVRRCPLDVTHTLTHSLTTSLLSVVYLRVAHRLAAHMQDGVYTQPTILSQLKLICAAASIRLPPLILQQDGALARAAC